MQKVYEFCRKYCDVVKTFSLVIATMIISMICLKLGQECWGIAYAILSALWFIMWILEVSLKWRNKQ